MFHGPAAHPPSFVWTYFSYISAVPVLPSPDLFPALCFLEAWLVTSESSRGPRLQGLHRSTAYASHLALAAALTLAFEDIPADGCGVPRPTGCPSCFPQHPPGWRSIDAGGGVFLPPTEGHTTPGFTAHSVQVLRFAVLVALCVCGASQAYATSATSF